MNHTNIPDEMKQCPHWILWKLEDRGGTKPTKTPYSVTGARAKVNDWSTWASFDKALEAFQSGQYSGLGFVLTQSPFVGIDIDGCIDPITGEVDPAALDAVDTLGSYTELSPSGKGLHVIIHGSLPDGNRRKGAFEMYGGNESPRYFTVTGNAWGDQRGIRQDQEAIQAVHAKYIQPPREQEQPAPSLVDVVATEEARRAGALSDAEVIRRAQSAANGGKFRALWAGTTTGYNSPSEADQALCNLLAYWTKDDAEQIDRLFRQSGLMRDKWDRAQSGTTYGAITILEAIRAPHNTYNPREYAKQKAVKIETGKGAARRWLTDMQPNTNKRYGWNDIGNGNLFADWYKDVARYVPERKKWFVYDGRRWAADTDNLRAMELCKKLADDLLVFALSIDDEKQRLDYLEFINSWQRRSRRETILKDAASVYPVSFDAFDADPYAFNCLNGTLDLKTGLFRDHQPGDMLSKLANVMYDPDARSERWERFMDEVMKGDLSKAAFLQKALGYALTGDTRCECFFILYGPSSRNGKGTTMETYMRLVGDYGKSAKPDTIAQKQAANGSGPSEDIARLIGARFVNISEPDQKLVLSAALVKTLTGNDTITARYLHENSFEYRPQFKLFINTNHLPKVTDVTLFSSGRVKLIPFERHFTEAEQDGNLKAELAKPENLSGILNWCLEGLRLIEELGFDAPESVRAATEDYRNNSDKLGRFLNDEMEQDITGEVRTEDAYQRFVQWCDANGHKAENAANFKQQMENVAEVKRKRPAGGGRYAYPATMIVGYRLKPYQGMPTPGTRSGYFSTA